MRLGLRHRLAFLLLAGTGNAALAQTGAGTQTSPPIAASDLSIDDIVVTAERRTSSVQDTPISITAFEGAALADRGVVTVETLSEITPALQIYSEQINNEEFIIRGVGRSNEDLTSDSGVAVNLNDVYLAQSSEADAALFDIERVEVLRGPQGTLYGKNAVGGVINIITRKPTDQLEGYASAEIGGLGRRQLEAAVGGPLVEDVLSARLAGYALNTDGAYRNLTSGRRANGVKTRAVRGSLRLTPAEGWSVDLVADWSDLRQRGVLKSVIVDAPGTPLILKDFFQAPYPTQERDVRSGRSEVEGEQGIRQHGGMLRLDRSLGAGTFSLIGGYRKERSDNLEDVDRTAQDLNNFQGLQRTRATTAELRFVSDDAGPLSAGGRLHWSGGLYWFHERGVRNQIVDLFGCTPASQPCDPSTPDDPDDGLIGPGSPDFQDSTASFLQRLRTDSYAAFGQAKFDIGNKLGLTAGLRYTTETKDFTLNASSVANRPGGDPFTLFQPGGAFSGAAKQTWRRLTPKLVAEYEPGRDLHLYASYARGFKSGGFNGQAGTPDELTPFSPEVADNFEVGAKSDLFGRRLRINAAAFYINFDDLQVSGVNEQGLVVTNNAATSRIKGFEVEATVRPIARLTLNGGVSYLDARYKSYFIEAFDPTIQGGPPFFTLDLSGKRLANVPAYSGTAGTTYELPLPGGSAVRLAVNATFKGDTLDNELNLRANPYAALDARLGWTSADGRVDVAVWVRNLTDKVYYRGGGAIPDFNKRTTRVGLVADPRTFGATAKVSFGR